MADGGKSEEGVEKEKKARKPPFWAAACEAAEDVVGCE